jgi:hypothetical protein
LQQDCLDGGLGVTGDGCHSLTTVWCVLFQPSALLIVPSHMIHLESLCPTCVVCGPTCIIMHLYNPSAWWDTCVHLARPCCLLFHYCYCTELTLLAQGHGALAAMESVEVLVWLSIANHIPSSGVLT